METTFNLSSFDSDLIESSLFIWFLKRSISCDDLADKAGDFDRSSRLNFKLKLCLKSADDVKFLFIKGRLGDFLGKNLSFD